MKTKRVSLTCVNGPFAGKQIKLTTSGYSTGVFSVGNYQGFYSPYRHHGKDNQWFCFDPVKVYWHDVKPRKYRVLDPKTYSM